MSKDKRNEKKNLTGQRTVVIDPEILENEIIHKDKEQQCDRTNADRSDIWNNADNVLIEDFDEIHRTEKVHKQKEDIPAREDTMFAKNTGLPEDRTETESDDIPEGRTETESVGLPEDRTETESDDIPEGRTETESVGLPEDQTETENDDIPEGRTETESVGLPEDRTETENDDIAEGRTEIKNDGITEDISDMEPYKDEKAIRKVGKHPKLKKHGIRIGIAFCILTGMYLTFVYSNIPFIEKWRTIYIETAMTTNSHQWLATWFFPQWLIDEVMAKREQSFADQKGIDASWDGVGNLDDRDDFYSLYWELESDSFKKYIESHPDIVANGYDHILIQDLDGKLGIKTSKGDELLVADTDNNLLIVGVKGDGYKGKLAIVKDPSQITFEKSKNLGGYGQEIDSFCQDHDALLGINASGFVDVDGVGSGGEVKGCLVIDGVDYGKHQNDADWKYFGFKNDNRMYITNYTQGIEKDYRFAMEFFPALIVNGKSVVDGTYGMGIQPRSAFGQTKNGDVLMLVVDGRQPGYSLGCTVDDCTKVLLRYQAYHAMNLDGGSSSVMYYDGNFITKSSSVTGRGRYMPDAFLVKRSSNVSVMDAQPASE